MRAPWTGRASRSADPAERIDALAQAMDLLDGDVPAEVVDEVAAALERADGRWGLDPSTTVAALVGATGSGKSSLFNALTGADLAEVGVLRPTTTQPLAAVRPGHDVAELVDWIGVSRRVLVPGGAGLPEGLVLIDLPDIDSVSEANREVAGRLSRRVDLLVWVFDPQKYADHVVHADWVAPLARHAGATVVALAQADLLDGPGRAAVEADLARLLAEDGVPAPRVVSTSVMTGEGIEELREILTSTAEHVRRDGLRVQGALDEAVERVAEALGPGRADLPDLDPDGLARAVADAAGRAAGTPRVARAVGGAYRHRALRECGWLPVRWVGRFRADPLVRLHLGRGSAGGSVTSVPAETESAGTTAAAELSTGVRRVADRLGRGRPPAWDRRLHRVARTAAEGLAPELDRAISDADLGLSRDPRWWGWMNAAQWLGWAAALAGLVWILGAGAADRFLLVTWTPPAWRGLPVPTWLVLGGVAVTLLVVGIGAVGAAIGWRRRARRARTALGDAVEEVVGARLVVPLVEEDRRQHAVLDALSRAARLR